MTDTPQRPRTGPPPAATARPALSATGRSVRLAALYGACFAGIGIYTPFFPLWLEGRGLDAQAIGVILALPILTRIAVTAPLMSLLDRDLAARTLLTGSAACLVLVYGALFLAGSAPAIAALVVVMAVAQAPVTPVCDLVATEAVRVDRRLDYGRIRLWGSVAFLAASVAGGYAVAAATADAALGLLGLSALATLAIVQVAVDRPPGGGPSAGAGRPRVGPVRLPRALWLLIGAAACVQASHGGIYAFGSLHWREQGFSEPVIGYLWAVGIVAEVLLFAAAGRVVGGEAAGLWLLLLGAGAAVVRFALMALSPGLGATFALQALHGLSFAATHISAMAAVSHLAPAAARGRVQGLLSTGMALGNAAATVLSGLVFQGGSARVFALMVPIAATGLVLALLGARALARQPHREGEGG